MVGRSWANTKKPIKDFPWSWDPSSPERPGAWYDSNRYNCRNEMIAVPSADPDFGRSWTVTKEGKPVEIGILFTGTLIPWESIIYAFSHDGDEPGADHARGKG